jgi:hypothetical protein
MQKTVYYLEHIDSSKRIKYYTTRTGARIACANRNRLLGFRQRIERVEDGAYEYEMYTVEHTLVRGTYCIVEDSIELEFENLQSEQNELE